MWVKFPRHTLAAPMKKMENQNIHSESWKGVSEALVSCQPIEWRGQLERCNNLEREWWHANRQLSDLITMKMEVTSQSLWNTQKKQDSNKERGRLRKVSSDHMKEWLKISESQTAVSQSKKRSQGLDGFTNEMLTQVGNLAIWQLLNVYHYTNIFWQEAHMEATYFPSEGKARQTLTIMRKLAGTT